MNGHVKALILILVCLAVLIPFASGDPDGLEMVAENLGVEETESPSVGLMPDYTVPVVENDYGSTLVACVIGVFLVLGAALLLGKTLTKHDR
ncbi:PDGLE domain-containing protein [Candidatus Bathyarchaeota archaeon]|nr:PDGLE domain-containing protein [Candidatus Bathyarchaeota archaeon]